VPGLAQQNTIVAAFVAITIIPVRRRPPNEDYPNTSGSFTSGRQSALFSITSTSRRAIPIPPAINNHSSESWRAADSAGHDPN
jgi:hypothetical protein